MLPPHIRVFPALLWPIFTAGILSAVINSAAAAIPSLEFLTESNGVTLGLLGLASLVLGVRWYGMDGLSFRAGRPMMAGVGFALLGWLGLLIARFVAVEISDAGPAPNLGITFLFLLIFEAFCVQLWTFGLLFRAIADRQNPLSAAIFSGVAYGLTAFLLFQESYFSRLSILYFIVLGIFYGIIRLRTGSFLGVVLVQAIQTLTVWHVLRPAGEINFTWLYGLAMGFVLVFTWRLWPRYVSDYRV